MMTKAVSVDKSDILMIKDLEVGMRTVARNIINKEEWVPCKILAKFGAFRDLDLSDDSNRKLYATRCGYRVEYIDTNDNSIITMVSLSDCAMELADLPPDILKEFKGLKNQISSTTDFAQNCGLASFPTFSRLRSQFFHDRICFIRRNEFEEKKRDYSQVNKPLITFYINKKLFFAELAISRR